MKCPHCKKDIRVALQNPIRSGGGRLSSPNARRSVSLRKNPGPRNQYRAKFGRKSETFYAKSDAAAETYCNGLLAHKMGSKPTSLQRTGAREPKK